MGKSNRLINNSYKDISGQNRAPYASFVSAALILISFLIITCVRDAGRLSAIRMLLACIVIAAVFRPLLPFEKMTLFDGGFSYSLIFGLFISFFLTYLLCGISGNRIPFDYPVCFIALFVVAGGGFLLKYGRFDIFSICRKSFLKGSGEHFSFKNASVWVVDFLRAAAVFSILFVIFYWIRGFRPDITCSTEQYMDYGFMQMFWREKTMCPEDIWQCGNVLNYYYLGQAFTTFLGRLSFVCPEYGYNLSFCVLYSLLGISVFTLVSGILSYFEIKSTVSKIAGVFGATVTLLSSNAHFLIYGIIIPFAEKITGKSLNYREFYWFPDATTFIGNYPDVADKGKTEFPAYSFQIGDLHAHVIGLFFTVLLLALLWEYAMDNKGAPILLTTLLLAFFTGSNYWDAPIYYVISGAVILFCELRKTKVNITYKEGCKPPTEYAKAVGRVLLLGLIMQLAGWLLMLPFSKEFIKMESGVFFCENHSPLGKMFILWGIPVMVATVLLVYIIGELYVNQKAKTDRPGLLGQQDYSYGYLYLIVLILCAIGLVLVPEVVYVKDIYGVEYARFNTMFKLTYQAFLIFSILTGVAFGMFASSMAYKRFAICICVIELLLSTYSINATKNWFGDVFDYNARKGISAGAYLYGNYDTLAEINAIAIINRDPRRNIHIMEAGGNSYTPDNKLSVFTGGCDVAGWYVHEWMWNNESDETQRRHDDVRLFYECGDDVTCKRLLDQYDIDYIFVGPREHYYYNVKEAGFDGLGEVVWQDENGMKLMVYE